MSDYNPIKKEYIKINENNSKQIIRDNTEIKFLKAEILSMIYNSKEGHLASSFSILDILYVLYKNFLKINDTFILSKGHASLGLYAILNHFGFLETDEFENFCNYESSIGGHPCLNKNILIEASTGSLGHGLPISIGIALANKIRNNDDKVYCLIGDGESNEGSIWEACLLANEHKLDNLCCIVDYNHSNDRAIDMHRMPSIFNGFGWDVQVVSGHNHIDLFNALTSCTKNNHDKPHVIIAETIKGFGCKTIENNPAWHHKIPNNDEYAMLLKELDGAI
jgi:transketolase